MADVEAAGTDFLSRVSIIHDALEEVKLIEETHVVPGCVMLTLKSVDTRQAAERVAWALMKSTAVVGMELTLDATAFTEALFTRSFCEDWRRRAMVWSPLKQAGLFCPRTLTARAEALIHDAERWSHDGRALLEFATKPDRSEILDVDMKLFFNYDAYQAFFNFIGEHYDCAYCLNNHACMVAGCERRPSDAFCPNFRVKGKTFRYEFRHQSDGIGGIIHACGKCAKSMLFYKKELVANWERSKANWARGRGRRPRESAFHKCVLKDGRCYHVDEVQEEDECIPEWWLFLLQHETAHPSGDLLIKEVGCPKDNGLDKARRAEKDRVLAEEVSAGLERERVRQEMRTTRMEWEVRQAQMARASASAEAKAKAKAKAKALEPRPVVVVQRPEPKPAAHRRGWQSSYIASLMRS